MRDAARRFNARYGETLVVPEARIPQVGARILDLQDPSRKMSTTGGSEQGTVYVLDEPDVIRRKFKRAQTDSGREIVRAADKPGITNLIEILAVARGCDPADVEREFDGRGYGDLKAAVGDAVAEWLTPGARALPRAARRRGAAGGAARGGRRAGPGDRRAGRRRRPRRHGRRAGRDGVLRSVGPAA